MPPSLMQALDAQQRMVDRLSDELRDLSRRIEERPRAMPAPYRTPVVPPMPADFAEGPEQVVDGMPRVKDIVGSNHAQIGVTVDANTVAVMVVEDNLVKGAAGGAVTSPRDVNLGRPAWQR